MVEEPILLLAQSPTLSRSDLQQLLAMVLQRFVCLVTLASGKTKIFSVLLALHILAAEHSLKFIYFFQLENAPTCLVIGH